MHSQAIGAFNESTQLITVERANKSSTSQPIQSVLEDILKEFNFTKICDSTKISIYDFPGKGGVAIFLDINTYRELDPNMTAEAALLYIGLEPILANNLTKRLNIYFGSISG